MGVRERKPPLPMASTRPLRLYVNIDHVATVRQARRATEPDPVAAALACQAAGADGITAHLREDRRHIQDHDVARLKAALSTPFNLEMAATDEMVAIARTVRPHQVTLVPERREEVTTEGGLDLAHAPTRLGATCAALAAAGIRVSLFIDPDRAQVDRAVALGVPAIELHTGAWAHGTDGALDALRDAAAYAADRGLAVHAGHGLTTDNVGPVATIPAIEELNIGHHLVARAMLQGIGAATAAMRAAVVAARG
jgi:pyridoxine 5-phosphate synthase